MRIMVLALFVFTSAILFAQKSKKQAQPTIQQADSLFLISDWNAAVPMYETILKAHPENSLGWNRLGFSYHSLSNYDKAATSYLKALEYKPAPQLEVIIHSRLARVYAVKNEKDRAFEHLNKALALRYSNLSELDTQKEFDNVRSDARFSEVVKRANLNAYPCMGDAKAREFDFWVGEWDAYVTGTNNLAGNSRIDLASGGCMILENWTSLGGPFSGKSMNFVDPVSGKWKQIWVGSGASPNATEFLNGEYREGAMRFDFETITPQGAKQFVRFHFYNQSPDQVRQHHETSMDGKTWVTTYDFTYKRKK